jgi:phage shock protein E
VRWLPIFVIAATAAFAAAAGGPAPIEPKQLGERIAWADPSLVVLDVRTPAEFAQGHIPGAVNIPHTELASRLEELSPAREADIVVYCRTGNRTSQALGILEKAGFGRLYHLQGDYTRWSEEKRPVIRPQ